MNLSLNTLITAVKAMKREMMLYDELLKDDSLHPARIAEYRAYQHELAEALTDLSDIYLAAREQNPEIPSLDDLTV